MKNKARSASAPDASASADKADSKPTLTVINNDLPAKSSSGVRPKVHMHPRKVKQAAIRPVTQEDEVALKEVTIALPAESDVLQAPEDLADTENNIPPASRFDLRFAIGLVALVIIVNLLLLFLVGSTQSRVETAKPAPLSSLSTVAVTAPPAESGVVLRDAEVKPMTLVPVTEELSVPPVQKKPLVMTGAPVVPAVKPAKAPAAPRDLLSIISQE